MKPLKRLGLILVRTVTSLKRGVNKSLVALVFTWVLRKA
jgi:hypothetical protein